MLIVRCSEVKSSPELRRYALKVYYALQPTLASHPYLTNFYLRLFSLIDFYCRQWIFLDSDPAFRMEAILTWQDFQQHVWPSAEKQ